MIVIIISFFYSIFYFCISKLALGTLGNAEGATMIVIITVIRSFGNAEDATMIVIIRVIILIIFLMIVIIVITFIIVIMIVMIISFFYTFQMWPGRCW